MHLPLFPKLCQLQVQDWLQLESWIGQGLSALQCVPNWLKSLAPIQVRIQRSMVMMITNFICKSLSTTENRSELVMWYHISTVWCLPSWATSGLTHVFLTYHLQLPLWLWERIRNSLVKCVALHDYWMNVHEMNILGIHTATIIVTNTDETIDLYSPEISAIMLWLWVIEKT